VTIPHGRKPCPVRRRLAICEMITFLAPPAPAPPAPAVPAQRPSNWDWTLELGGVPVAEISSSPSAPAPEVLTRATLDLAVSKFDAAEGESYERPPLILPESLRETAVPEAPAPAPPPGTQRKGSNRVAQTLFAAVLALSAGMDLGMGEPPIPGRKPRT